MYGLDPRGARPGRRTVHARRARSDAARRPAHADRLPGGQRRGRQRPTSSCAACTSRAGCCAWTCRRRRTWCRRCRRYQPNSHEPPARRGADRRTRPAAAATRRIINPLGFALEKLDGVGRYRDARRTAKPIDATSSYTLDGQTVSFDGAVELQRPSPAASRRTTATRALGRVPVRARGGHARATRTGSSCEQAGSLSSSDASVQKLIVELWSPPTPSSRARRDRGTAGAMSMQRHKTHQSTCVPARPGRRGGRACPRSTSSSRASAARRRRASRSTRRSCCSRTARSRAHGGDPDMFWPRAMGAIDAPPWPARDADRTTSELRRLRRAS